MLGTATTLAVEEVSSDWSRLEMEWHQLWRELPEPTPFQTFAWIAACQKAFGEKETRILIARTSERILGIFPFIGDETIELIGGSVSDYQDALVFPGYERSIMHAAVEHLLEQPHRWSNCVFKNVRAESALLYGDFGDGYSDQIESDEVCPVLGISGPSGLPTSLPQTVPAHQRDKVRYYSRRAAKAAKVEFESVTWENLDEFQEALFRLHRARWSVRGQTGVLNEQSIQTLHRAAAPGLHRKEILRMYAMRMDQKIVGVYLGFFSGQRALYYLSGFDPAAADFSPGMLLIAHAIEEAIREGATCFDFLRGAEPYKYAWGAHDTHTYCRKIVRL
jgi:CelD/BcsL family acetyltransferase involved in cellulose biosynthesis